MYDMERELSRVTQRGDIFLHEAGFGIRVLNNLVKFITIDKEPTLTQAKCPHKSDILSASNFNYYFNIEISRAFAECIKDRKQIWLDQISPFRVTSERYIIYIRNAASTSRDKA